MNSHILFNVMTKMYREGRYGRMLVVIDTCQAASLIPRKLPPSSAFLASSSLGEESYSLGFDLHVGFLVGNDT